MVIYTALRKTEIQGVANQYDLAVTTYSPIEGGAGNSSYLIQTQAGEYVLTVFEIGLERVMILDELLLLLEEYDFPTTRLLTLARGGRIASVQRKPVMVKPYIPGQVVKDLDEMMLEQIGMAMARLHQIPAPDCLPDIHAYGLQTFPNVIGQNIDLAYEAWLAERYAFLGKRIPAGLPRGIIHGDLFYDNALFTGEEFQAIIDFEEACQYYKTFDLGMGIVGLCTEGLKIDLKKVQALVTGYQQVRPLEKKEKNSLLLFVEYAAIATSSWRYWNYNIHAPNKEKARHHREMVQIAKNAQAITPPRFLQAAFGASQYDPQIG